MQSRRLGPVSLNSFVQTSPSSCLASSLANGAAAAAAPAPAKTRLPPGSAGQGRRGGGDCRGWSGRGRLLALAAAAAAESRNLRSTRLGGGVSLLLSAPPRPSANFASLSSGRLGGPRAVAPQQRPSRVSTRRRRRPISIAPALAGGYATLGRPARPSGTPNGPLTCAGARPQPARVCVSV
jgi:hypothetical protein